MLLLLVMILLGSIKILVLPQHIAAANGEYCVKTNSRSSDDYVQSFSKFTENLRKFFAFPFNKIENKRQKLKKAFNNFIDEVREDNEVGSSANSRNQIATVKAKSELVESRGFKQEYHTVITTDGYKLALHRIVPENKNETRIEAKKVALLHHGLLGSSSDWILLGQKKALPYLLLDAGYDVWLANARGSHHSRSHVSRPDDSKEFWDFSFHEIGKFDLSATIDYVRVFAESNSKIDFIGHSMGATSLLVLLSSHPRYNQALRSATFLGPLAFMQQVKGPLRVLGQYLNLHGADSLSFLGEGEFLPVDEFPPVLRDNFCEGDSFLCKNNLLLLANGGQEIIDFDLRKQVLRQTPAGGSSRTVIHYCQLVTSGQFQMYDWGSEENMNKIYGKESPPIYRLNMVSVPVVIYSSSNDWLSTTADVLTLSSSLPNVVLHHNITKDKFSHTDFVWSLKAIQVYYKILDTLNKV